jgi:hypothetical protein
LACVPSQGAPSTLFKVPPPSPCLPCSIPHLA